MNWHVIAKRITDKWIIDGYLPRHANKYLFNEVVYTPDYELSVIGRMGNYGRLFYEICYEHLDKNEIIKELFMSYNDKEKIDFLAEILGAHD